MLDRRECLRHLAMFRTTHSVWSPLNLLNLGRLVSITFLVSVVHGQAFAPIPAWGSAYTFQEGQSFVIQGGSNGTYTIPQTFSIDLSSTWETSSVSYKRLLDGPSDYKHSATLLKDKQNWFMFSNGTGFVYGLSLNSWRALGGSVSLSKARGLGAATDPDTGYIYVPNGYIANGTTQMLQYDIDHNNLTGVPMHPALSAMVSYSIAWSSGVKKIIVFGGSTSGTNDVSNNLYTWDSLNSWMKVTPVGDVPTPRRSACMVPAYNGTKMVLFGGLTDQSNSVLSDVYLLDTATMTWTKGTDAGVASARAEASCAVSNDLFIAWGGGGVNTVITSNLTIVYNIKRNTWQSHYSPFPDSASSSGGDDGTGQTLSPSGPGSASSRGAIIGGVVGGLAAIAFSLGLFLSCRTKKREGLKLRGLVQTLTSNGVGTGTAVDADTVPETYLHSATNRPTQVEPWHHDQWQQPLQPPPMAMHSTQPLAYSPTAYLQTHTQYQPPIIHDYHQRPQIFQPHSSSVAQQRAFVPEEDLAIGGSVLGYGSHQHDSPTLYHPLDSSMTESTCQPLEHQSEPGTPYKASIRTPQNPQFVFAPDSYVDDDTRRNPQDA